MLKLPWIPGLLEEMLELLTHLVKLKENLAFRNFISIMFSCEKLMFRRHNKKKCILFFEIQQIRNLKEDDSPLANNKLTRLLADGSPKQ